jgi:O-succinylbenzoic acid--CoA ligase
MLRGSFQVEEFLQLAAKGSVTHASLVPTMLHHSLEEWGGRKAPSSLECLLVGGAEAHAGLIARALATNFPLALTYGLTQASSQVTTAPPALVRRKPGTVGPPLKGVDVRLAPNGEILVRGPTVAPGEIAPDGWLHTGDLAREDADGDLWITGRLSHRIISGGMNVDPAEVEAVLLRYPGVREAAVVGLSDPEWGERVAAAIVWVEAGKADLAGVERFVREVLSKGKRPRVMRSVAELPRNPNGKVDRDRIRSLFR